MFRNYNPDKYDPNTTFELPPAGEHALRVEDATSAMSRNGNEMIKVTFSVDGYPSRIFHYFVDNEFIQGKLDSFFSSFGIDPGDFSLEGWRGRRGMARIKHEEYQGTQQAKVWYFVKSQDRSSPQTVTSERNPADDYADDFPLDMSDFDGDDGGTGTNVPF
jgi:hypothetical protein